MDAMSVTVPTVTAAKKTFKNPGSSEN